VIILSIKEFFALVEKFKVVEGLKTSGKVICSEACNYSSGRKKVDKMKPYSVLLIIQREWVKMFPTILSEIL